LGENEELLAQFEEHLVRMQLSPLTVVNYMGDLRTFVRWGVRVSRPGFCAGCPRPGYHPGLPLPLVGRKAVGGGPRSPAAADAAQVLRLRRTGEADGRQPGGWDRVGAQRGGCGGCLANGQQVEVLLRATASEQPSLARRDTAILMLLSIPGYA